MLLLSIVDSNNIGKGCVDVDCNGFIVSRNSNTLVHYKYDKFCNKSCYFRSISTDIYGTTRR